MNELTVPGYDVVELLGFGAGGEVWLAREVATGSPVALKRLRDGGGVEARERLSREAAVLAGVRHPHVVRLRGVVGAGDSLVLVLDLAAGGSLARILSSRRTLTPGEVVTVGVPLAQALSVVHGQGVVHGDVSPANVLFAGDGRPQLSDLGMSRLLGAPAGAPGGTCGFIDPDVSAGNTPTMASDVLGLAATCWAALTGSAPFDPSGQRRPDAGAGRTAEQRAVLRVLEQALAPVPAHRPTADQLAAALFRAARSVPVQLVATGGPDPRVRPRWLPGDNSPTSLAARTHVVARPVTPIPPAAGRRRPRRGRRSVRPLTRVPRPARRALAALLGAAAVAGAAVTGVAWAGADNGAPAVHAVADSPAQSSPTRSSTPVTVPSATPPARGAFLPHRVAAGSSSGAALAAAGGREVPDWGPVLARLDAARGAAFATAETTRLRAVYVSGSPAMVRDRRTLLALRGSDLRAVGVQLRTSSVSVLERSSREVRLQVGDSMPGYQLIDPSGEVQEKHPGRGLRRWTVVLRARPGGGWGVYDVLRG